jgi:hypothetical protein
VDSSLSRSPWLVSLAIPLSMGDFSSFKLIKFSILHCLYSSRNIDLDRFVTSEVSGCCNFFFGERVVDEVGSGIIEIERIHRSWEEVSEGSFFFHSSEYFVSFFVPFFFRILFVEDAELFVFESDASQAERAVFEVIRIENTSSPINMTRTIDSLSTSSSSHHRVKIFSCRSSSTKHIIKITDSQG